MLKSMISRKQNTGYDYKTYCDSNRMFSFSCSNQDNTWSKDDYFMHSRGRFRF